MAEYFNVDIKVSVAFLWPFRARYWSRIHQIDARNRTFIAGIPPLTTGSTTSRFRWKEIGWIIMWGLSIRATKSNDRIRRTRVLWLLCIELSFMPLTSHLFSFSSSGLSLNCIRCLLMSTWHGVGGILCPIQGFQSIHKVIVKWPFLRFIFILQSSWILKISLTKMNSIFNKK